MIFISNKKFRFDERSKERYFYLKLFKKLGIIAVEIITDQDFKSEISGNEKVVVKYFADWCGNCRLLPQNSGDYLMMIDLMESVLLT